MVSTQSKSFPQKWLLTMSIYLILIGVGSRMLVIGGSKYLNQSAENLAVLGALEVSEGKNIFPTNTVSPFRLYTYTPVHAWLVGTLISPLKSKSTLARAYAIRFLSFVFLILSFFVFWKFFIHGNDIPNILFAMGLALGLSEFGNYGLSGRNDTLALMFEIVAGSFFVCWIQKRTNYLLLFFSLSCSLALLTRQNSASMIISGGLFLLLNRRWRELLLVTISFLTIMSVELLAINHYFPYFWSHSFKTHIGVWRAFYWLHPSTLFFIACYFLFFVLGLKNILKTDTAPKISFLKLAILVSAVLSFILIHRHGAWLNYFLETILLLSFFTSRELVELFKENGPSKTKHYLSFIIAGFALFICAYNLIRTQTQFKGLARLDFPGATAQLKSIAPQGGVSLGAWAQGLGVYLRDWELIGPEILNGGHYGEANYKNFQWVYQNLKQKIETPSPPALVYVNPDCGGTKTASPLIADPHLKELMGNYQLKTVLYSWLCVYMKPNES